MLFHCCLGLRTFTRNSQKTLHSTSLYAMHYNQVDLRSLVLLSLRFPSECESTGASGNLPNACTSIAFWPQCLFHGFVLNLDREATLCSQEKKDMYGSICIWESLI